MHVRQSRLRRTALAAGVGVIVAALTTAAAVPGPSASTTTDQPSRPTGVGTQLVTPQAPTEAARIAAEQAAAEATRQTEQRIIDAAAAASGGRYRWGGTTPAGFDCSGYTQYVFRKVGISLPRTSAAQRAATIRISQGEARPGDLVFQARGRRVHHVSIYAGDGMVYEALQAGTQVGLKPLRVKAGTSFGRLA